MNALLPLVVVAVAGTATIASADDFFTFPRVQGSTSLLHFDHVNSDAAGVLEIYDYNGHVMGKLLGSRPVVAGSNSDLRVMLNPPPPVHDVYAVLTVDGETKGAQVVEFRRSRD